MSRRQLAVIAPLMAVASVLGVVISGLGWGLAATILAGYACIAVLTIVGIGLVLVERPFAKHS